ncbi:MAG: DUF1993 domain-containing protein [Pseudomonadota bacterium]
MAQSFYNNSAATYLQILGGVAGVLKRGEDHAAESGLDLDELVRIRLRDDMAPFSFQVISVWHHSMGGLKGMQAGLFEPPPKMSGMTYPRLKELVDEARDYISGLSEETVNAISGKEMVFRIGERDIPFTTDNFLMSFSIPNFMFHATTTYAVLRMQGVPLGKMDFLGQLRVGV